MHQQNEGVLTGSRPAPVGEREQAWEKNIKLDLISTSSLADMTDGPEPRQGDGDHSCPKAHSVKFQSSLLMGGKGISVLMLMKPTLLTVANPGGSGISKYYYEELVAV